MGMDVYGKNPKNETGEYFRNNVWWWRPLWEYCLTTHPKITSKVKDGHSNSGDGLDASDAKKLALFIQKDIDSGFAKKYQIERQKFLDNLPDEDCTYCKATGVRNDTYVQGECNVCNGKGKVRPWATAYPFDVENLQEFQRFLDNCGGFQIW